MRRVSYYRAAFDPPCLAQQSMALRALEALDVDSVLLAPVLAPAIASFEHRCEMLNLLLDPLPVLKVRMSHAEQGAADKGLPPTTSSAIRWLTNGASNLRVVVVAHYAMPLDSDPELAEMIRVGLVDVYKHDYSAPLESASARRAVRDGRPTLGMVPERVRRYIDQHNLYR